MNSAYVKTHSLGEHANTHFPLDAYLKSVDFADNVGTATEQCRRCDCFLVNQLNRAALSISSNIAEGNGRFTKADRKNLFIIARGSVQECVPQLELAQRID